VGEPTNQHREDVIAAVRKRGGSLSALAKAKKIHPSSMSHCLTRPLRRANAAIAEFLGLAPSAIWPEWFDEDGKRRPRLDASRNPEIAKRRNPEIAKRRAA